MAVEPEVVKEQLSVILMRGGEAGMEAAELLDEAGLSAGEARVPLGELQEEGLVRQNPEGNWVWGGVASDPDGPEREEAPERDRPVIVGSGSYEARIPVTVRLVAADDREAVVSAREVRAAVEDALGALGGRAEEPTVVRYAEPEVIYTPDE